MSVNLKKFVDINIQKHISRTISGTRDIIILFTPEVVTGTYSSLSEYVSEYPKLTYPLTYDYVEMYFNNSGAKIKIIGSTVYFNITTTVLESLDNSEIVIASVVSDENLSNAYTALKTVCSQYNASHQGIDEKIVLCRADSDMQLDTTEVKNLAVKYSSISGAEMTIAAYLSKIDVYGINTVRDYMFTLEQIPAEDVTDTIYDNLIQNNYNLSISLANSIRNCGGNLKNGYEISNEFVRIILTQTLTNRLLDLLVRKLKSYDGLSKIYSVITQELERYKTAGYLSTDKIWSDDDLFIDNYLIIEKGTPLINGYIVKILPFSSLTQSQILNKETPAIYVIISDQYGIRKITINGEVI